MPFNLFLLALAVGLVMLLLQPRLRNSSFWRATITPLASIIGSGFLVVAPLLGDIAGRWAAVAMLAVVLVAYAIGAVIRFNIRHAEPLLAGATPPPDVRLTERLSDLTLSAAYLVSVAFYVRLLSAFVLKGLGQASDLAANTLTTVILAGIGLVGWRRGLHGLERLEEYSVTVKLAIIGALLAGLVWHDTGHGFGAGELHAQARDLTETLRLLAGILLVVQGFETSRYLGEEYPAAMRIRSMRLAQWISGAIYVVFIVLVMPLLVHLTPGAPDETAIIDLARYVAPVLPAMLVVAAAMSQFSAAVADTVGAGGLLQEQSDNHITSRTSYVAITGGAIVLTWTANVFEIITLASRAFALYYLVQTLTALTASRRLPPGPHRRAHQFAFAALAVLLTAVVLFAVPAG